MNPADQRALRTTWGELLLATGVPSKLGQDVFVQIVEAYSSPGRVYHTLDHVAEVLQVVDDLSDLAVDPISVRLAAWFHDAAYDSHANDNEERSAALAKDWLARLGLERLAGRVAELILATKNHIASDEDAAVLIDADVAILGADPNRYDEYAHQIREEYRWVPEPEYRVGRRRVLESFTNRDNIFRTARMRDRFEASARSNIERELTVLAGNSTIHQ